MTVAAKDGDLQNVVNDNRQRFTRRGDMTRPHLNTVRCSKVATFPVAAALIVAETAV